MKASVLIIDVPSGVKPRGAVMSGAFTDLATLLETYNIAGWIPLLQPFQFVPFFFRKFLGYFANGILTEPRRVPRSHSISQIFDHLSLFRHHLSLTIDTWRR